MATNIGKVNYGRETASPLEGGRETYDSTTRVVACMRSSLGNTEFSVSYTKRDGFLATVRVLRNGSVIEQREGLPISGVPREVRALNDISKFRKYFQAAHLVLEKGRDGTWNRVTAHISGRGGMREMIAFQPGLRLGSLVNAGSIKKLKKYAHAQIKIEGFEQRMRGLTQKYKELQEKIASLKTHNKKEALAKFNEALLNVYQKQLAAIEQQMNDLAEEASSLARLEVELPNFTNVVVGLSSPVDFTRTKEVTEPRGFDSVHYSSNFIDFKEDDASIRDKMSLSASSGSVSGSTGGLFWQASASHSWSQAVMDRVGHIKSAKLASSVLVITALVTTRFVRRLENLTFSERELRALKKEHEASQAGDETLLVGGRAYILSEAVMGGSFSAILSFVQKEGAVRQLDQTASHRASQTTASGGYYGISASGTSTSEKAVEGYDDSLRSRAHMNVELEFIAQGVIPEISRDSVVRQSVQYVDTNLQKFQSVGSPGPSFDAGKERTKMVKSAYAALERAKGTEAVSEEIFVHTPNNVLKAYNSFSDKITGDEQCGVPIGFGFLEINVDDELQRIAEEKKDLQSLDKVQDKAVMEERSAAAKDK